MNTNSTNKRPKVCGNKCVVCGKSKFSHAGLKLFIFPRKDEARCEKWINSTGYFELKYLPLEAKRYVCELHFDDKDFMSVLRNRLMPNAVPKKSNTQPKIPSNKPTSYYRSPSKQNNQIVENSKSVETSVITRTTLPAYIPQSNSSESIYTKGSKNNELNNWPLEALANSSSTTYDTNYSSTTKEVSCNKDISQENVCEPSVNVEANRNRKKVEFIPMIQPYYKRNCRPAPCKHCKRKDKTIIALRKRVRELKRIPFKSRIDQLKNISNDSKTFAKMFLTHGSHRVWTEEEKTFAIDLLNKSSSAYYFLRHNKKLILPSKASVQSWIRERTKDSNEQHEVQNVNMESTMTLNPVVTEVQQIHHIPNPSVLSTIDNLTPLTCAMEIPMAHPNDNIISIPEVTNDIPQHMQTMTTLEPMHTSIHHLSAHHQEPGQLSTGETHYKYAYQIITQEGISNKSTYIIHLNES